MEELKRATVLTQKDLYKILPFKEDKIKRLIRSGEFPVVKVGRDYITTYGLVLDWIAENICEEIYI